MEDKPKDRPHGSRGNTPLYRVTRRGEPVNDWIVAALPTETDPHPAPVAEFATEKDAIARAELLNAAAGLLADDAERDEVLRRMLGTPRHSA